MAVSGSEPVSVQDLGISLNGDASAGGIGSQPASSSDIGDRPVCVDDLKMAVDATKSKYEDATGCFCLGMTDFYTNSFVTSGNKIRGTYSGFAVPSAGTYMVAVAISASSSPVSADATVKLTLNYDGKTLTVYNGKDIDIDNYKTFLKTIHMSKSGSVTYSISQSGYSKRKQMIGMAICRTE